MARAVRNYNVTRKSVFLRDETLASLIALLEDPVHPGKLPQGALDKYLNKLIRIDLQSRASSAKKTLEEL